MKHISPSEIPEQTVNAMRDRFEADPRIREMRARADRYARQGMLVQAACLGKQITELFDKVVASYIEEAEQKTAKVSLKSVGLPKEDSAEITRLAVAMVMAADIMDSCVMNIDEILHRTDESLFLESFDDLREMAKLARGKVAMLAKSTACLDTPYWGDVVDNMFEMMRRKAGSIVRKTDAELKKRKKDGNKA